MGKFWWLKSLLIVTSLALAGCYVEVQEEDESSGEDVWGNNTSTTVYRPGNLPREVDGTGRVCQIWDDGAYGTEEWYCYSYNEYEWRTSCQEADCQGIKVFTHYMLTEGLGAGHTLHIEAFDNAYFNGAPVSATQITNFEAETGEWEEAEIFLSPGEYYLRAYLKTEDESRTPYQFGDMDLVADQPVGVFGALSGAQKITVQPRHMQEFAEPVHIYLDKLFEKPGDAPDTRAYLRLNLSVAQGQTVADGRQVLIRLFETPDFNMEPVAEMKMASELLLVSGRVGEAEYVSASLPVGKYFLQVFVDGNSNGYLDDAELQAQHEKYGELALIEIAENRTETVALTLAGPDAEVPAEPAADDEEVASGD